MLFKGFKGICVVTRPTGTPSSLTFRFTNADFSVDQGVNFFTPSYGGKDLRRIVSPNTGNITGRIALILCQGYANFLYDIAYNAKEISFDLYYRDGKKRTFTGCKVESLTFACKAGEFVQASLDVIAKNHSESSGNKTYTLTEKIVDWTKSSITGIFTSDDKASFNYNIKNNLVVIKTGQGLFPHRINQGIQEVSGDISIYEARLPMYSNSPNTFSIFVPTTTVTFAIDNWSASHYIVNHWSYRTPLSPEMVITTLDWTRVDRLS
jgi:hypothetical protein